MRTAQPLRRSVHRLAAFVILGALTACNSQNGTTDQSLHASSGQVKPAASTAVSRYAAARFADQVSFGATPALVAEIEKKGYAKWIDDQFLLPVTAIDTAPIAVYDDQVPALATKGFIYYSEQVHGAMLNGPDQLRQRVTWALSQFITVSQNKVQPYGTLAYANLLQQHAFGNYGDLIRAVTINPSMGIYLDNLANRPTTKACPWCAPNENYARELLQLFTLGVVILNPDGSMQRDANRRPLETYTQKDVEELARALTGWTIEGNFDRTEFRRYDGVLKAEAGQEAHDAGAKIVMGHSFPAGADAGKDLDTVVAMLMAHQNIAPFVSLRLIQHLVTSNPSPAYIGRVSAVFRNNGRGVAGDLKAVVKAVLLDTEARRGDQAGADTVSFGKMREPVLWYTGLLRGLACRKPLYYRDNSGAITGVLTANIQQPFNADSVFSFYLPTDRAPGSNLLAPEQKLLNAEEFTGRLNGGITHTAQHRDSGCDVAAFGRAFSTAPSAFADLVSERYFRGAMPAVLRQNLIELAPDTGGETPDRKALSLLQYALSTPYYGVIR